MDQLQMQITGYLCPGCGHFNNLKLRKWWRRQTAATAPPSEAASTGPRANEPGTSGSV